VDDLGGNIDGWSQILVIYVVKNGSSRFLASRCCHYSIHIKDG